LTEIPEAAIEPTPESVIEPVNPPQVIAVEQPKATPEPTSNDNKPPLF
jgi:hypothetical protein